MATLLNRWLTALRASDRLAVGRECDYAMSEHDADRFDALGLLALAAGDGLVFPQSETGWRHTTGAAGVAPGAWLTRQAAEALAAQVGLDAARLVTLCELNDLGRSGGAIADWVEGQ
jgi:hypothetical protein